MSAPLRRFSACTLALALFFNLVPTVSAAERTATFDFRNHCESQTSSGTFGGPLPEAPQFAGSNDQDCRAFVVKDPLTLETQTLSVGDTLDFDLVLRNPGKLSVNRIRAWLSYDPTILSGSLVEIGSAFPLVTPGEEEFAAAEGYVKIGASANDATAPKDIAIAIAHIRMKVIATPSATTAISFYDLGSETRSHTAAVTGIVGAEEAILAPSQASLVVKLAQSSSRSSSSVTANASSSVASSTLSSTSSALSASSVSSQSSSMIAVLFNTVQPQGVKVTTEGSNVMIAWAPIPHPELAGYNVYYGTISGQYIQRRSTDRTATNTVIRGLPEDVTYYFAVRGVGTGGIETDYSQEVAVSVGNPATSTSPLTGQTIPRDSQAPGVPSTGGEVAGATGVGDTVNFLLIASAIMGTIFAFRRQLSARSTTTV